MQAILLLFCRVSKEPLGRWSSPDVQVRTPRPIVQQESSWGELSSLAFRILSWLKCAFLNQNRFRLMVSWDENRPTERAEKPWTFMRALKEMRDSEAS